MSNRRDFIKNMTTLGLLGSVPDFLKAPPFTLAPSDKIWACLLHLSYNMWEDHNLIEQMVPGIDDNMISRVYDANLRLSEHLWRDALKKMAGEGMNMVLIDLGDAIRYESHPEIAVKNAWSSSRLKEELAYIRQLGLEPIPKLNFSTSHDTWLGEYSRMVSTPKYYEVCRDLIAEVTMLFDKPRFFHLGYDEEMAVHQKYYNYVVVRQNELWWKDFYFFVNEVEKNNTRPWIWSDYVWHHKEVFYKKMPKSVLQSNWYYEKTFDIKETEVKAYVELESHEYDQVPTGGYYEIEKGKVNNDVSILKTVQFCEKNISDKRLLGFMQTIWRPTTETYRNRILEGIGLIGDAENWYKKNHR